MDAYVASLLCNGGPIKCKLQQGLDVTDVFLFSECIPNIEHCFEDDYQLCECLGLAHLWVMFDEDASVFINSINRD